MIECRPEPTQSVSPALTAIVTGRNQRSVSGLNDRLLGGQNLCR